MRVLVQSYPPLGQVTPVEDGHIQLRAVLEAADSQTNETWQVSAWHSLDGTEWSETRLEPSSLHSKPQCLQPRTDSVSRLFYEASFSFHESLQFTIKYRHTSESDWTWAGPGHGLLDGTIVLQRPDPLSEELEDLIENLNPEWEVTSCSSQTPRTLLWCLEAEVPGPRLDRDKDNSDTSSFRDIPIGIPRDKFLRWFALVRHSSAWLAPRQGKEHLALDKDAVLCSFLTLRGRFLVFLGLGGINDVVSVFRNTPDGHLSVHARSDSDGQHEEKSTVLVAESADLGRAVAAAVYHARTLAWNSPRVARDYQAEKDSLHGTTKSQSEWSEKWYDGLGFCTWNSLGQQLTEEKILNALDALAENNIQITNFIMDDNWQSIDYRGPSQFHHGWLDFDAEPKSFPNGLKATVTKVREKHPQIRHIAVWHALLGYWGGISTRGRLAKAYKTIELPRVEDDLSLGDTMTVVDQDDVARLYDDFYNFLANAGIDAVKTDVQFMVDTWASASARRKLLFTYLDTWNRAALCHFDMRTISCMSLFPQWLFYLRLSSPRPAYPVRSSDDFFPDVPGSHPWHLWANAHNCILLQLMSVLPDWDMFQTAHEYAGFHAAARCVSGGPIYITDVPREHDIGIILQISGKTPKGMTIIFRPSVVGRAISPFVGYQDNVFLKVGSYHGASETGTPIMGVFNVSDRPLTELIALSSFSGTNDSLEYVVRAHTTGLVSSPTQLSSATSFFNLTLDIRGYEILSAFPLKSLPRMDQGSVTVANMGLVDKMTGCAAIIQNTIKKQDNGRILVDTSLKALGVLGVYISSLPDLTIEGDFMVTIQGQAVPIHTVKVSGQSRYVLEVDIETAWEQMELEVGWSDEVGVKINFAG